MCVSRELVIYGIDSHLASSFQFPTKSLEHGCYQRRREGRWTAVRKEAFGVDAVAVPTLERSKFFRNRPTARQALCRLAWYP